MPRTCKLCLHPRRSELDAFIAHGTSYKVFRKKFGLRSVSVYCWSRHRNHLADRIQAQAPDADASLSAGMDVQALRILNRKLKALAMRSEKAGRAGHAISAYSSISRNLELISRLAESETPTNTDPVAALTATECQSQMIESCRSERVAAWLKYCLYQAGHRDAAGLLEAISSERLTKQLIRDASLRQRLMDCVVAAQEYCEVGYDKARRIAEAQQQCSENLQASPEASC